MIFHVQFGKLCILLFKLYEVGYLEQERGSRTNFPLRLVVFLLVVVVGLWRRPLQHGHPAEVSGSPEGSLSPLEKLIVTLATRSGVTQIVIFLTH